jgi:hypothetical protein
MTPINGQARMPQAQMWYIRQFAFEGQLVFPAEHKRADWLAELSWRWWSVYPKLNPIVGIDPCLSKSHVDYATPGVNQLIYAPGHGSTLRGREVDGGSLRPDDPRSSRSHCARPCRVQRRHPVVA